MFKHFNYKTIYLENGKLFWIFEYLIYFWIYLEIVRVGYNEIPFSFQLPEK